MTNKWVSLSAGSFLMLLSGTLYLFPAYSADLKGSLGLTSASSIQAIGTGGNVGTWVGVLGGIVLDRFGVTVTSVVGALLVVLGYGGQALGVRYTLPYWAMAMLAFCEGQGSIWLYTVALKVNTVNFPIAVRGRIMGASVAFFGLCAGLFSLVYKSFFVGHIEAFFWTLAFVVASGGIIGSCFITEIPASDLADQESLTSIQEGGEVTGGEPSRGLPAVESDEFRSIREFAPTRSHQLVDNTGRYAAFGGRFDRVDAIYLLGLTLGVLIGAAALLTSLGHYSPRPFFYAAAGLVGVLMLIPIGTTGPTSAPKVDKPGPGEMESDVPEPFGSDVQSPPSPGPPLITGRSHTVGESLRELDFYLINGIFFAAIGTSIVILNSIFDIVLSLSDVAGIRSSKDDPVSMAHVPNGFLSVPLVSLFSVFNMAGRLLAGIGLDRAPFHRAHWLSIGVATVAVCSGVIAVGPPAKAMYPIMCVLGLAYGSIFCTSPTLTADVFGTDNFGAIWGLMGLAPAAGSILLSTVLAGTVEDRVARHSSIWIESEDRVTEHCASIDCFRYTLFGLSSLCFVALGLSFWLTRRLQRRVKWEAL